MKPGGFIRKRINGATMKSISFLSLAVTMSSHIIRGITALKIPICSR